MLRRRGGDMSERTAARFNLARPCKSQPVYHEPKYRWES